jgi:glucose/arabinose dehydrogenase
MRAAKLLDISRPPPGTNLGLFGTSTVRTNPWNNRAVRLRVFLALLLIPLLMIGGLVLAIRGGKSEVADQVSTDTTGSPTSSGAGKSATGAAGSVRLVRIGTFKSPLYVTSPPGDRKRVFVVEQGGKVYVLVNGKRRRSPFIDLTSDIVSGGEQGLLSIAFAPDYKTSGRFYVDFTDRNGNSRVQQFLRSSSNPNQANRSSRRQVLFVKQPYPNHNGGQLQFGPDKLLYIGFGDGGSEGDPQNRAQNLDSPLGKILRIDPKPSGGYSSPSSNPFVGKSGLDSIYAYGFRNPWRFTFDDKTGDLYIGDVGQNLYEEIDYAPKGTALGVNYGWSCFEGRHGYKVSRHCPNPKFPVLETSHSGGNCSITGGYLVRDPNLPSLDGRYLYGDYCAGNIRSFKIDGGKAASDRSLGLHVSTLTSFGVDGRGRIYVTSQDGPVYRLSRR